LNATGRQSHATFARAAASAKLPVFESTLPEQFIELKNEETIQKSENLRYICTSY
jgi:hypothetical protein